MPTKEDTGPWRKQNQIQFLSAKAKGSIKVMKAEIQAYTAKYLQKFCVEIQFSSHQHYVSYSLSQKDKNYQNIHYQ